MKSFTTLTSRMVPLPIDNIDTDIIVSDDTEPGIRGNTGKDV